MAEEKKKPYTIEVICVEDRTDQIVKSMVKRELKKILDNMGVVSYNLDEVLDKYITGEMRNEQKGRR